MNKHPGDIPPSLSEEELDKLTKNKSFEKKRSQEDQAYFDAYQNADEILKERQEDPNRKGALLP